MEAPAPQSLPDSAVKATLTVLDSEFSSSKTLKIENTEKRDELIQIEKRYQQQWQDNHVFESDAPTLEEEPFATTTPEQLHSKYPKWMGTMAYPYMNGTLHAGHCFTASKVEFGAGFARMQGKRALFPLGWHVTGMPIKACADKLVREIEMFGTTFERCPVDDIIEEGQLTSADGQPPAPTQEETKTDMSKFSAKKGKASAKSVKTKYQFQIMLSLGIPLDEIHKFADTQYWLKYFPPLAKRDLTSFGARIDWRRQMVTTDANPYYDSFVAWQMRKLKELGKIKFGKRYTVYSPKDGQACLDHDRQSGEGVAVQEYTALKLKVKEWPESAQKILEGKLPQGANVYFVPATLRPETMYGQTCCFVGPKIKYGVFKVSEEEFFVLSERAARNMSFQGIFPSWGVYPQVAQLLGADVIGTLVNAPLSVHKDGVRILPMETVKDTKGTAVVTSVPSDSPDDYATVLDLAKKADYYKIKQEWAELEMVPIIDTPTYGNLTAKALVEELKIQSPKDTKKLEEAKEKAYKEGFYKGTMIYGSFAGKPVEQAKGLVRQQLLDDGLAFNYAEPDGLVISRSGDVCVVALQDQWYMNYGTTANGGDGEWAQMVLDHIQGDLNTYYPEAQHAFTQVINWLSHWACSRSYGLGTKLPWDHSVKVESLSDSTIYQSYYTFAHLLHKDLYGKEPGVLGIKPDEMSDDVWDYILGRRDTTDFETTISKKSLETMRRQFDYWYPLDIRTSGKDLIQNHLTFNLYVHAALFKKANWPRSFRVNGHLMLNGEKMSKSTGNFLTLEQAVSKFGADATRIALADAGDGIEDANFAEKVADTSVLKLFELKKWCEEMVQDAVLVENGKKFKHVQENERIRNIDVVQRKSGTPRFLWDDLFDNEMNTLVAETKQHYENTMYKSALKSGYYDFTTARDFYREVTRAAGLGMHEDLARRYIELQALLLTPIAPHFADYVWQEVLKKPDTVQNALFPNVPEAIPSLTAAREYVRTTASNITSAEAAQIKKLAKGKAALFDPKKDKKITLFVATAYPAWQTKYINLIRDSYPNLDIKELSKKVEKAESKKAMPFLNGLKRQLDSGETKEKVLDRRLAFDELETLRAMVPGLMQTVRFCKRVEIVRVEEGGGGVVVGGGGDGAAEEGTMLKELPGFAGSAEPGSPSFLFENV
ncbi:leucyl-tRNA synthetase [Lepidopterella palustris CBS 459.81]|uniref:leucine--tRNA ligase n=1 Tax=Lepidopterella palustris CBS 459.81 TaxID=1314670 RepID=A0A8E2E111_9PEZI|nr:leucyl-tRNA synthetase [Lepidopterella palustris CBS 459.81]